MIGLSFVGLALFAYFQRHPLPAEYRDRQAAAVFHVAGVSGRRGRPGDCGDHGGVAVEHRLGDQLVHVGGRGRSLQPPLEGARRARRRAQRRRRSRAGAAPPHRHGDRSARSARRWPATCRGIGSLLEINARWSTRSPARCSASSCWRCSAARARSAAALAGRRGRRVHGVLRGVSQQHRLHVAVDVRPGGDAGRRLPSSA